MENATCADGGNEGSTWQIAMDEDALPAFSVVTLQPSAQATIPRHLKTLNNAIGACKRQGGVTGMVLPIELAKTGCKRRGAVVIGRGFEQYCRNSFHGANNWKHAGIPLQTI